MRRVGLAAAVLVLCAVHPASPQDAAANRPPRPDLTTLSLEELANVEVTTVSRKPEGRLEASRAVHVITSSDVRRSGVLSLADALRLAPGVEVARVDSSRWAVAIRGFNSVLSRSALVLQDGRSLYTPLFAGVFWDVQDTVLFDLERIEVSRGPAGALFGANALTGVIDIVTRPAHETQGWLLALTAGTEDHFQGVVRHGGRVGERTHYRAWGKFVARDAAAQASGEKFDSWHLGRAGLRFEREDGRDQWRADLGGYGGEAGQRSAVTFFEAPFVRVEEKRSPRSGGHALLDWRRRWSHRAETSARAVYDLTRREEIVFEETRQTLGLDLHQRLRAGRHDLMAGLEARRSHGRVGTIPTITLTPPVRNDDVAALFVSDEVPLGSRARLTLGSRAEWNDYSGWNLQPAARVLFRLSGGQSTWASVSRAVRTTSRAERDATINIALDPARPVFVRRLPDPAFRPESVVALEAGHRAQWTRRLFTDVALHRSAYRDLATSEPRGTAVEPPGRTLVLAQIENRASALSWGAEATTTFEVTSRWRLQGWASWLKLDVRPMGSADPTAEAAERSSPRGQGGLTSFLTLGPVDLDAYWRRVGGIPAQGVGAYSNLDARVALRPRDGWEVALVGQNLLRQRHAEFAQGSARVQRAVYVRLVRWW